MVTITRTSNSTDTEDLTIIGSGTITSATSFPFWLGVTDGTGHYTTHVVEDIIATTESLKKKKHRKIEKTNSGLRKPTDRERRQIIDV